jgi:hypothetical protein
MANPPSNINLGRLVVTAPAGENVHNILQWCGFSSVATKPIVQNMRIKGLFDGKRITGVSLDTEGNPLVMDSGKPDAKGRHMVEFGEEAILIIHDFLSVAWPTMTPQQRGYFATAIQKMMSGSVRASSASTAPAITGTAQGVAAAAPATVGMVIPPTAPAPDHEAHHSHKAKKATA